MVTLRSGIATVTTRERRIASLTKRHSTPLTRTRSPQTSSGAVRLLPTVSKSVVKQARFLADLGDGEGRQADHAAPNDPAQALIIMGRQLLAPDEEDEEGAGGDCKSARYADPRLGFRGKTEKIGETQRQKEREQDREQGKSLLEGAPPRGALVPWYPNRESEEPDIARCLCERAGDILRQQGHGRMLKEGIEFVGLARIEPDDVEEKAPGHPPWSRPDEPGGSQDDEDGGRLIEQEDRQNPKAEGALFRHELDLPPRPLGRGGEDEFAAPPRAHEAQASQGGEGAGATVGRDRDAAHPCEVEAIARPHAGFERGRVLLLEKGAVHIRDEPAIIRVEAEGAQGPKEAMQVGHDHGQRPKREDREEDAVCDSAAFHVAVSSHPGARRTQRVEG